MRAIIQGLKQTFSPPSKNTHKGSANTVTQQPHWQGYLQLNLQTFDVNRPCEPRQLDQLICWSDNLSISTLDNHLSNYKTILDFQFWRLVLSVLLFKGTSNRYFRHPSDSRRPMCSLSWEYSSVSCVYILKLDTHLLYTRVMSDVTQILMTLTLDITADSVKRLILNVRKSTFITNFDSCVND